MSKYPRTYHFNWSPGSTNDDRISDSVDHLIGIDIVITEKLDGSNSSITKNGVYGRSHVDFSKNPWDREMWNIYYKIKNDLYLLDIPTVPILFKGRVNSEKELKELTENLSKQPSSLGGIREGVVVRNANMFHNDDFSINIAKWVRAGHVTTSAHWTRNWKKCKIKNT